MTTTDQPAARTSSRPRFGVSRRLLIGAAIVAVLAAAIWYLFFNGGTETTDDANIDGRAVTIAPKIGGYVTRLLIDDNQRVQAGDVLLELDQRDYLVARDKAAGAYRGVQAQLDAARINLDIASATYPANLSSARADRDQAQANLVKAQHDLQRQRRVDIRATTPQQVDAATAAERSAAAVLAADDARVRIAELAPQNIAAAHAQVDQLTAQIAQAKEDFVQAELNLSYTRVTAPQDGWITKRAVEMGDYVQPGQALTSLVSPDIWVTANFKEAQLTEMRPGQAVVIKVDAFPNLHLTGRVDGFQMGTGARFSAFPAENATGNFVKIVQRLPVKIVITGGLDPKIPLPIGLSVETTVKLR